MLESLDTLIAFVVILSVVSLLVTVAVQMISAALNLRGENLSRALAMTLDTAVPGATRAASEQATRLAEYILKLPHLSDTGNRAPGLASAIRPQEVFATLVDMAAGKLGADASLVAAAEAALANFGVPQPVLDQVNKARTTIDTAEEALRAIGTQQAKALADALHQQMDAATKAAADALATAAASARAAWERFNFWFEACQDRAQQWFAAHTRLFTIGLSFAAAIGLQLDTIEIYRQVSSNRTLRDKLVASATAFSEHAEQVLADNTSTLAIAHQRWSSAMRKPRENGESPSTAAAHAAFLDLAQAIRDRLTGATPAPDESRTTWIGRIATLLAGEAKADVLVRSVSEFVDQVAQERVAAKGTEFTRFQSDLQASGFQLFVGGGGRWADEPAASEWRGLLSHHLLGMLFTAGLLTLGAPFWFNVLKSLAALRSVVARDISKEEQKALETAGRSNVVAAPPAPPM